MRVAILGGSFNPPHLAHVFMAESVLNMLYYDKVILVPAKNPPHKKLQGNASNEDRLAMLKLATAGNPHFLLDDFEIRDEEHEYSYTVNTIQYLYRKYDEIEGRIGLIIGADLIQGFHKWHKVDTILAMSDVIAIGRGEANNLDPTVIAKYNMKVLDMAKSDTSSTIVRSRVQAGLSIKGLVCDGVRDYILLHGLYV